MNHTRRLAAIERALAPTLPMEVEEAQEAAARALGVPVEIVRTLSVEELDALSELLYQGLKRDFKTWRELHSTALSERTVDEWADAHGMFPLPFELRGWLICDV